MMSPSRLALVVGNDRLAKSLVHGLGVNPEVTILIDKSNNIFRIMRVVRKGSLSIRALINISISSLSRPRSLATKSMVAFRNCVELRRLLDEFDIDQVILFRASIIIDSDLLADRYVFYNIHCARLPEFPGLGSLFRAWKEGEALQYAQIHRVSSEIDQGEILFRRSFEIPPNVSYRICEDIAYRAGFGLVKDFLDRK